MNVKNKKSKLERDFGRIESRKRIFFTYRTENSPKKTKGPKSSIGSKTTKNPKSITEPKNTKRSKPVKEPKTEGPKTTKIPKYTKGT